MMNMNNYGILKGRLVADPVVFGNTDGSSKVKFTLACEDNFKDKDGKRNAQMIPVEAYVKDYQKSPYTRIGKGDKISVQVSLRTNNYTDKDGKAVYSTIVFIENLQFEESKAVTEARRAANAQTAAQAAIPVSA